MGKPRVMQLASDLPVPGQAGEQPWPGRFTASAIAGSGTIGQGLAEAVRARTTAIVDADRLAGVLRCRVPLPGERVRLLGAAGSRPLRKILADRRVAPDVRTCWPVVADPQGAVWIAGVGIADRCRISDATERAVLLRWAPPRSVATVLVGGLG
ncbi:MAG: tRNA lysidine(34) synthetase TilS [Planctomycetota bacterium]